MRDDLWDDEDLSTVEETRDLGLVLIRLGKARFAVNVASVVEVAVLKDVTRLFRTPPHIRGIMNLRGRILPVADLGMLLEVETDAAESGLLLRNGSSEALFAVDEVLAVEWISSKAVVEIPSTTPEHRRIFYAGVRRGEEPATILNTERLFHSDTWLRFEEDAAA